MPRISPTRIGLALILFAGVREKILLARVPRPLQDTSIALVTAGDRPIPVTGEVVPT